MFGIDDMLIAQGAAQLGGGILGAIFGGNDRAEAEKRMKEAYQELLNAGYPPDLSKQVILDKFQQVGVLTPELEQTIAGQLSEVSQLKEDPELRQNQLNALEELHKRGKVGLTPEEKAEFNALRAQNQRDLESKRQQILQSYQARGLGGGGQELAAQLAVAQQGAQIGSEQGDRMAAEASRRALQSILSGGQLAGSMRAQDFDVNRAKAQAADEVNRFNTENARAVQMRNISSKNAAQDANLREQQRVADANVAAANAERYRQNAAREQHYQDMVERARGLAAAKIGQKDYFQNRANQTAQNWQNIGTGIGGVFGSIANNNRNNELLQTLRDNQNDKIFDADNDFYNQPGPWASGYKY